MFFGHWQEAQKTRDHKLNRQRQKDKELWTSKETDSHRRHIQTHKSRKTKPDEQRERERDNEKEMQPCSRDFSNYQDRFGAACSCKHSPQCKTAGEIFVVYIITKASWYHPDAVTLSVMGLARHGMLCCVLLLTTAGCALLYTVKRTRSRFFSGILHFT